MPFGASPSLGSFHSLFHRPSNPYTKLENFITQNSTENLISSVSDKINHHRALKDISEALEQKLSSSKDISGAHRVF